MSTKFSGPPYISCPSPVPGKDDGQRAQGRLTPWSCVKQVWVAAPRQCGAN